MNLMPFQEEPFNGDKFIAEEFVTLRDYYDIDNAVETGSCLYPTTLWLSQHFKNVFTIEINEVYSNYGKHRIENTTNVHAELGESVPFLYELGYEKRLPGRTIFFLDAHWGEVCPLQGELQAIAGMGLPLPPVIAIHDFFTGNPELGFDSYQGQAFTYEWIKPLVEQIATAYNDQYTHYFNEKAEGAKRGIIYITPTR